MSRGILEMRESSVAIVDGISWRTVLEVNVREYNVKKFSVPYSG